MNTIKNQEKILQKLGIEKLNPMQENAIATIMENPHVILLSPTGTGKTIAFLLPTIAGLSNKHMGVQALILVPSRELAIQIEQVIREMGAGFKVSAVYGGKNFSKDKLDLKHPPTILIGTPGRVAAHLEKKVFSTENIKTLVLDEFDKSLNVGFSSEMKYILSTLKDTRKIILTSATSKLEIPSFVPLEKPITIVQEKKEEPLLTLKKVLSSNKDTFPTLLKTISHLGEQRGIIFCNFKRTIEELRKHLKSNGIPSGGFHGDMEQKDREKALIKFRNGTYRILIATDLAARGLDIPELNYIIHFQLPEKEQEFTHRNGRTARMFSKGVAYVIEVEKERPLHYLRPMQTEILNSNRLPFPPSWKTLFISGGRQDKISKGDLAGFFMKQGKLSSDQLGVIELKKDCSFVAVQQCDINELIERTNAHKIKKKKVKVVII